MGLKNLAVLSEKTRSSLLVIPGSYLGFPGTPDCLRDQLSLPLKAAGLLYWGGSQNHVMSSWEVLSNCTRGQLTKFKYYQVCSWWARQVWVDEEDYSWLDQAMRVGPLKREVSLWYWALVEADDDSDVAISRLWAEELGGGNSKEVWLDSFSILRAVVKPASLKRNHLFTTQSLLVPSQVVKSHRKCLCMPKMYAVICG